MKLGIISDTHSHEDFVKSAVELFKKEGVDCIIHCGDVTHPEILRNFEVFSKLIVVRGNMDRDVVGLKFVCNEIGGKYYDDYADLTLGGKQIAVLHSDNVKRFSEVIESEQYDYIFYGHTHRPVSDVFRKTRLVNPGSWDSESVCIVDLDNNLIVHKKLDKV